jgi:hypothetical protein
LTRARPLGGGALGFATHLGVTSLQAVPWRNALHSGEIRDVDRRNNRMETFMSGRAFENSSEPAQGRSLALMADSRCVILQPVGA